MLFQKNVKFMGHEHKGPPPPLPPEFLITFLWVDMYEHSLGCTMTMTGVNSLECVRFLTDTQNASFVCLQYPSLSSIIMLAFYRICYTTVLIENAYYIKILFYKIKNKVS